MTTPLSLPAVWLFCAWWQSTLCLGVAFLLAKWGVKSPWRGHVLLCTGIFAAVLAPTLSTIMIFRNGNFDPSGGFPVGLTNMLGVLFVTGMLLFAILLVYGVMMSRRLMFHARPFPDRESQEALLAGAKVLQNVSLPILFTSDRVKSPTVWCWGLHPAVLLPEELTARLPAQERDAIFLHELAHITRRDHLTALFCRLSGMLLFWHPLWWLALWLGDLLADEACDLLVLSRGTVSPGDYSDLLLKLAAGTQHRPAFQFLSRKEKMMKRIDTIFDFAERFADRKNFAPPGTQRLWTGTVVSLALLLCAGLAYGQARPQTAKVDKDAPKIVQMEPANGATDVDADMVKELRVTFDRDMDMGGFSWTGGGENYPKTIGKPKWIDKRTCVLTVDLEEGKTYTLGINSKTFKNFKSAGGVPVEPVIYTFATQRFLSYEVNKNVADFPNVVDLTTPEAAYAWTVRLITGDDPEKMEKLGMYTLGRMKIPEATQKWIENMSEDEKEAMKNARIVKVLVYKNTNSAMVIAEQSSKKSFNFRWMKKEDDNWLSFGQGNVKKLEDAEKAFQTAVARWNQEQAPWKTPDNVGHTHLAIFEPVGDFDPKTPQDLLEKLNASLFKRNDVITGYFRTGTNSDGKMVGRICTNNPMGLKEVIESIPELKLTKIGAMTEETFAKHSGMKVQRDTSGWTSPDEVGHTHLAVFAGKGNFKPKDPRSLLDKLNATLFKANVATGYFRTWPDNGRLIGGICTNDAEGLQKVIEAIPDLELIKMEPLNEQIFKEHTEKGQLSL